MQKNNKSYIKKTAVIAQLFASAVLSLALLLGCAPVLRLNATDLMYGITARRVAQTQASEQFVSGVADFSLDLFRHSFDGEQNTLVSPTSVLFALAMTANGASGQTLAQMQDVLAGGMPTTQLNRYLHSFNNSLPSVQNSRLEINNSIWFNQNGFTPNQDFLQTNADYFGANAYAAAFDDTTLRDINSWVSYHTDGMIDSIIDEINPESVMHLINTVMFDAEWASIFCSSEISNRTFYNLDGTQSLIPFMTRGGPLGELRYFISDDYATGFIKPYALGHYSFVALLPNESVSIADYAASLTGTGFVDMVASAQIGSVWASIPKFEFEFDVNLNRVLKDMGMPRAFSATGELEGLGTSPVGPLFIAEVEHATFISVNERGTRAGAATSVETMPSSAPEFDHFVNLNRPFVFAIVDNNTNLPIFIGAHTTAT